MADRAAAQAALLKQAGWAGADVVALAADASTRRYSRLSLAGETALLMDAPPTAEAPICPPTASPEDRRTLGYNASARLAGSNMTAFCGVAEALVAAGIAAPRTLAVDKDLGFAVIEDFGDHLLRDAVSTPAEEERYYRAALDVLRQVRAAGRVAQAGEWPLLTYDPIALQSEADLFAEWYAPHYASRLSAMAQAAWYEAWQPLWAGLAAPAVMVLRDYHAENILVRHDGSLGVIDFQDCLLGHAAYDVASLLEDARRDVDLGLAEELLHEDRAGFADPTAYDYEYAVLALQRNLKILGVFARLIHRDQKPKYAQFMDRVRAHVKRDLQRPDVEPILRWVTDYMPAFQQELGL